MPRPCAAPPRRPCRRASARVPTAPPSCSLSAAAPAACSRARPRSSGAIQAAALKPNAMTCAGCISVRPSSGAVAVRLGQLRATPPIRRPRSRSSSASARRVNSTSAVSITSWLVLPQCTTPAASASNSATVSVSLLDQRNRQAAGARAGRDDAGHVVQLGLAGAGDRRRGGFGHEALGRLRAHQRGFEVEHRLHGGVLAEHRGHFGGGEPSLRKAVMLERRPLRLGRAATDEAPTVRYVRWGQRRARAACSASLRRSARGAGPTALSLLGLPGRRRLTALTAFAALKHAATSQFTKRAGARGPENLRCSPLQRRCARSPERVFADTAGSSGREGESQASSLRFSCARVSACCGLEARSARVRSAQRTGVRSRKSRMRPACAAASSSPARQSVAAGPTAAAKRRRAPAHGFACAQPKHLSIIAAEPLPILPCG